MDDDAKKAKEEAQRAGKEMERVRNELEQTRQQMAKGGKAQSPSEASTAELIRGEYDK